VRSSEIRIRSKTMPVDDGIVGRKRGSVANNINNHDIM
jgi:hypothetical protein